MSVVGQEMGSLGSKKSSGKGKEGRGLSLASPALDQEGVWLRAAALVWSHHEHLKDC